MQCEDSSPASPRLLPILLTVAALGTGAPLPAHGQYQNLQGVDGFQAQVLLGAAPNDPRKELVEELTRVANLELRRYGAYLSPPDIDWDQISDSASAMEAGSRTQSVGTSKTVNVEIQILEAEQAEQTLGYAYTYRFYVRDIAIPLTALLDAGVIARVGSNLDEMDASPPPGQTPGSRATISTLLGVAEAFYPDGALSHSQVPIWEDLGGIGIAPTRSSLAEALTEVTRSGMRRLVEDWFRATGR